MAVYERTYKGYRGSLTPVWSRFLVLPMYTYQRVFQSKLFLVFFFLAALIPTLVGLGLIYLFHNVSLLQKFGMSLDVANLITATFFRGFLIGQGYFGGFILALIVGPPLISSDLANNGMPLYFSRPLTRTEYALGKMSILVFLLSAVTWVPNLLMFLLKAYMAGDGWILENFRIGAGIFLGSWIGIITLTLVTLAVSATTKHKARARLFLFSLFFIVSAFGGIIGEFMRIWWGKMLQLHVMIDVIVCALIGVDSPAPAVPLWAAWFSILAACGLALLFLRKKIRAYEIVR